MNNEEMIAMALAEVLLSQIGTLDLNTDTGWAEARQVLMGTLMTVATGRTARSREAATGVYTDYRGNRWVEDPNGTHGWWSMKPGGDPNDGFSMQEGGPWPVANGDGSHPHGLARSRSDGHMTYLRYYRKLSDEETPGVPPALPTANAPARPDGLGPRGLSPIVEAELAQVHGPDSFGGSDFEEPPSALETDARIYAAGWSAGASEYGHDPTEEEVEETRADYLAARKGR